jgi:hypothetical protein
MSTFSRIERLPSLSFTFEGETRDTNHAVFAEQSPPASTVAAGNRTDFVHHHQQSSTATHSWFLSLLSKIGFYLQRPPTERHPAPHHQRSFSRSRHHLPPTLHHLFFTHRPTPPPPPPTPPASHQRKKFRSAAQCAEIFAGSRSELAAPSSKGATNHIF